jgi:hypothetical protein
MDKTLYLIEEIIGFILFIIKVFFENPGYFLLLMTIIFLLVRIL